MPNPPLPPGFVIDNAPQGVTVPLGPPDPFKRAAEQRAERADTRAAAAEVRAQKKFEQEDTMAPPPGDTSKMGEEYLSTIPPTLAAQVKALAEGRRAFPTGTALRSPAVQQLIAAATQYDPTLDAANAATRVKTRQDFTSGKSAQNITAINTALGHFGTLWQSAQGLENRTIPAWNAVANAAESASGDPRVSKFNLARNAVVNEMERVFRGSGGSEADIQQWRSTINSSMSPKQLRESIAQGIDLLNSRLDAIGSQYNQGMNRSDEPITLLNPHAQTVFNALAHGGTGALPPDDQGPPPAGPTNPGLSPATGPTKTEITHSPLDAKIAAMLSSGTPSANIRAFAKANGYTKNLEGVLAFRAMHPEYKGGYDVHSEKVVPTTLMNRVAASPLGAGAASAADAGLAGFGDEAVGAINTLRNGGSLTDNIADADFRKQLLASSNPKASLAGSVVGGTAAMLGGGAALKGLGLGEGWLAANPIKAAVLGDTAYGTAFGTGENNDNRLLGAGTGFVTAPIASFAGQGATRAIGAGLRGVVNPAVDRLRAAGIPLTTGEVLGGGWKKAQDALTSVFGPGNMVARRYADGRRALNEAAFNQAGQEVGAPINAVGQQGIEALDRAKSQAYSNALDPVTLDMSGSSFTDPIRGVIEGADAIPQGELPQGYAGTTIRRFVGGNIDPQTGIMTGRDFQKAYRGLAQTATKAGPKVEGHDIAQSLGQAKDILATTLQEQNPAAFEGFLNANSANRHLSVLRKALEAAQNQVSDSGEQLFTPAQLGRAATGNAKTYGGSAAAAAGNRPFNQLALDAQQVMSSKLPESGTAPRLAMLAGLSALGGGTGYGTNGSEGAVEGAAVPAVALSLLGTRRGQQLLTAALLKRVAPFRVGGDYLARNPQLGGAFATATGIPLLSSPSR